MSGTKVYGASDDLIEIEGDYTGEYNCYGTDDSDKGVLLVFSDGTLLEVKYGKGDECIWAITLLKKGSLFDRIDLCEVESEEGHSDIAYFKPGIKFVYAAQDWEKED